MSFIYLFLVLSPSLFLSFHFCSNSRSNYKSFCFLHMPASILCLSLFSLSLSFHGSFLRCCSSKVETVSVALAPLSLSSRHLKASLVIARCLSWDGPRARARVRELFFGKQIIDCDGQVDLFWKCSAIAQLMTDPIRRIKLVPVILYKVEWYF